MEYTTQEALLGHLFKVAYEQALLETSLSGMLFHHDFWTWGTYHTPGLICTLWEFCQEADITLTAPLGWAQLQLQRENDHFLMEAFESTKLFEPEDLERINQCRRFLEVLTLVDVATGDGTRI